MQDTYGYYLVAVIEDHEVKAAAGYRVTESLAWGKYFYVDDLITDEGSRRKGYAKTYAVSYESEESTCSFEKNNETTLHAICELPFKNYSDKSVEFTVEFKILDSFPLESIMNSHAPYKVRLKGKERRVVKIETSVDVSKLKIQLDSGEVAGFNLIIQSGDKSRKL